MDQESQLDDLHGLGGVGQFGLSTRRRYSKGGLGSPQSHLVSVQAGFDRLRDHVGRAREQGRRQGGSLAPPVHGEVEVPLTTPVPTSDGIESRPIST